MAIARRAIGALLILATVLTASPIQAAPRRAAPKRRAASASATAPASSSLLVKAGLQSLERKDYAAAIDAFGKATRAEGSARAYFLLGYAHYQRGFSSGDSDSADKKDARGTVSAYMTALALDPQLEEVAQPHKLYHSLGLSYETLGEYEKAIDAYRKASQAAPRNPMLPLYAARLRYRMNDLSKSASNLKLTLKKARETGQLEALLKVIESDPQFSMMLNSDDNLAALRKYDPSARAPESDHIAAATPLALAKDATLRDSVRNTAPADDRVANMRRVDADVLEALSAANDEFKFRRYLQAINDYQQVLLLNERSGILNPTQSAFIYERIGASYNKLGLSAEAIKALLKCLQIAPMAAAAHYQLSLAYAVVGRYQDSLRAVNAAFKNAPSTGELKRYLLLAKTDVELEAVRDLPAFRGALDEHGKRALR